MHSDTWFIMFLNVILIIICMSGTLGHTNKEQNGDGKLPQQWNSFVTLVNKKIEWMESLLKQKDDRVVQMESVLASQKSAIAQLKEGIVSLERASLQKDDHVVQLESALANYKSEIDQLTQGIVSIERASLQKDDRVVKLESALASQKSEIDQLTEGMASLKRDLQKKNGVVDRLVKTISELQNKVIHCSISREGDTHSGKYVIDSNSPQVDRSPSSNKEQRYSASLLMGKFRENELKRYASSYSKSEIENTTNSQPHAFEMSTKYNKGSRTEETDEADVKDIMSAKKSQIRQRRVAPPSPSPKTTVAFHVTISDDAVPYTKDAIVIYGHETLDQGNGYNPVDGIYITPETGTYVLTWTTICEKHNYFQTVLVVNGSIRGSSWTESADVNDYHQTTAVVILRLNQGDHVFIRMGHKYGQGTIVNYNTIGSTTFSGWKLD